MYGPLHPDTPGPFEIARDGLLFDGALPVISCWRPARHAPLGALSRCTRNSRLRSSPGIFDHRIEHLIVDTKYISDMNLIDS
jgi:hypothetical protein